MSTLERVRNLFIENFEFDGEKLTPETVNTDSTASFSFSRK